ncbi:MAG: flagellar hook-associated protein FlgK [Nitrospirae bacterium]|nr:flagellar hook-associated protein FlgK [Nitrospirota bacterium]
MSISGLFNIGKSAISASQTALAVINNNIANANTPNYVRQDVTLEISTPVMGTNGQLTGSGVTLAGIRRSFDRFIEAQLTQQQQYQGRSTSLEKTLSQVEQVFNEQQGMGLQTSLTEFFNAWHDVSMVPDGQPQRILLLQKAGSLVAAAQRMETGLTTIVKQANEGIADLTGRINEIAAGIASLNDKIVQMETGQGSENAGDLRSQRDNLLNQLAGLADISSYESNNGSVTITMGMRNLVSGGKANALSSPINRNGDAELFLDGTNITGLIRNGQLGGLMAARNDVQDNPLLQLRELITSVIKEVNNLHRSGFGLDGSSVTDFFSPLQLTSQDNAATADVTGLAVTDYTQLYANLSLKGYDITFGGGNYTVTNKETGLTAATGAYNAAGTTVAFDGIQVDISGAVADTDSFLIDPSTAAIRNFGVAISNINQIAASSSATELPGNNSNALLIARLASTSVSGLGSVTFMQSYTATVAYVGAASRSASDTLKIDDSMLSAVRNKKESVSGVSLDEEAANMIRYQRAFEAGARMIKMTDELMQTLLNL